MVNLSKDEGLNTNHANGSAWIQPQTACLALYHVNEQHAMIYTNIWLWSKLQHFRLNWFITTEL